MTTEDRLAGYARLTERALGDLLSDPGGRIEPRLGEAMRYSLLSGGKRLRPALVLAAAEAAGGAAEPALPFACAVEMVHTYSLIHDDLPAMDDDPVRRGKPSSHVKFGDAVAILAGDALLTDAFGVIARGGATAGLAPERTLAAVAELAGAAGAEGMVGGQTADVLAEGEGADAARVESIHRRKTGALLRAAVRLGGLAAGAAAGDLERLTRYGEAIGLAFQIADDVLDETGNVEATGKGTPRDRERGKSTYPTAIGLEASRARLRVLLDEALDAIAPFGERAAGLRTIARMVVERAL